MGKKQAHHAPVMFLGLGVFFGMVTFLDLTTMTTARNMTIALAMFSITVKSQTLTISN